MKLDAHTIFAALEKMTYFDQPGRRAAIQRARRARVVKWNKDAAKARKKRFVAASKRRAEEMRNEWVGRVEARRAIRGGMMIDVILAAMEPGHWYARIDVMHLTGFERDPTAGKLNEIWKKGLLRREENPDWDPTHHPSPIAIQRGEVKAPQWLYTMSEAGEARRGELVAKRSDLLGVPQIEVIQEVDQEAPDQIASEEGQQ